MARVDSQPVVAWHRRIASTLLGSYQTRMMLSLAFSVTLVALCFHLPLDRPLKYIGWQFASGDVKPTLTLVDVKTEPDERPDTGVPITTFGAEEVPQEEGEEDETSEPEALPNPAPPPPVEKLKVREAALDFAEKPPDIVGGLGAYYIHIEYPEQAIAEGIEGRLILTFVVEKDGQPSEIQVMKALHPLCDSSAVQALRKTRFIPGRQNGEPVRVRMRLPVQFRLINPGSSPDTSTTRPASSPQKRSPSTDAAHR